MNPLNVLQAIFTGVWSVLWLLVALAARVATGGTRVPLAIARRYWAPGLLWVGGMRLDVQGLERIDPRTPYFFASNHQSMVDVPVLLRALPVPLLFIVKEELRRVPLLGTYMRAMGMIFIRRTDHRGSLKALRQCQDRLTTGRSILIFPEGTRSRDGSVGTFKPGSFLPVIDAGAPVVPVALDGPGRILPRGGFRVRPGPIRVAIGKPIATDGLGRKDRRELAERVRGEVVGMLRELVEEDQATLV